MDFDSLYQEADALRVSWSDLFGSARANWDGFDRPMAVLQGMSAHDLDRSFRLALELLFSVKPADENSPSYAVLASRQQDVKTSIQGIAGQVTPGLNQLKASWRDATRIVSIDTQFHWSLEENGARYVEVNLNGTFKSLPNLVSVLMALIGQIIPLCNLDSTGDLTARSEAFSSLLSDTQPLYNKAKSHVSRSEIAAKKSEGKSEEIETLAKQAEADLVRLRELLKEVNTDHAQVTAQTERVKQSTTTAETLAQTVTQYQAKFDDFKIAMDERLDDLADFEKRSREADKRNKDYEENIKALIAQSEDMLAGSTTVGLAKAMEATRKRYADRMLRINIGFFLSVIFLLVSALPLAIHLIPGLVEILPWFSGKDGKPIPTMDPKADGNHFAVLGKFMLLLPATWLTAFFTKTYANLFQLEREYAHKAALAGSIHGFKLEAKNYEQEITAEVFMEIRNNPARGPAVESASHPLYDVLSNAVTKGVEKIKNGKGS